MHLFDGLMGKSLGVLANRIALSSVAAVMDLAKAGIYCHTRQGTGSRPISVCLHPLRPPARQVPNRLDLGDGP